MSNCVGNITTSSKLGEITKSEEMKQPNGLDSGLLIAFSYEMKTQNSTILLYKVASSSLTFTGYSFSVSSKASIVLSAATQH